MNIYEITISRSELALAETQIIEIQKELDCHKQECYGHMKVIQELRFGKMQASGDDCVGARESDGKIGNR